MRRILNVILLITATLGAATSVHAQTQKGNLMVGTDLLNIMGTFQNGNNQFNLGISPKLGYFLQDNFVLGAEVDFSVNTSKTFSTFNYSVSPFARYYFDDKKLEFSKRARFFLEANVGFAGTNTKDKITDASTSTNGLAIGFGPGLAYFITPNVALEALLKYDLTVGFGNSTTTNRIGLNLGFQIYLPTKHAKEIVNEEKKNFRRNG
ncbi:porin family protein [Chitinophaga costaii]|nr:outer membrane beta-barrel protein [Chitinophaga costaii]PUZ30621.1 porin family protein [Chitinophaga costaii]